MINSMTGYGRAENKKGEKNCIIEIRAVNHRFLEISLKFSKKLSSLEDKIKKIVKNEINRGYIEIFIKLEDNAVSPKNIIPDMELSRQLISGMKKIKKEFKLGGKISIDALLPFREIFKIEEIEKDFSQDEKFIETTLLQSLTDLKKMRQEEGKALYKDLEKRLNSIKTNYLQIKKQVPKTIEEYRLKLSQRIKEALQKEEIDAAKLAQEIVFFTDRCDVSEELTRLESHCRQFIDTLNSEGSIGKKIEFIVQEINREVNTIGSKANDALISEKVIEMKCEIEKIREQIQNIE